MKIKEANEIVAEYMGFGFNATETCLVDKDHNLSALYSDSLDALVPVWEKLDVRHFRYENRYGNYFSIHYGTNDAYDTKTRVDHMITSETIQEAACIATAKAIQEN